MMGTAPTIIPHLWYDMEAKEAAEFYVSVFPKSKITNISTLRETPSGDAHVVSFELWGQKMMSISAGPHFQLNPAVSFIVNFDPSREEDAEGLLTQVWDKLSDGGTALMPLGEYPFSKKYGWIQDKYGLSWQLMLTNPEGEERPEIIPSLLFVGEQCGRAEEALRYYLSVFKNAQEGSMVRYPQGMEPDKEGTVMFADYKLENLWFSAMDSAHGHKFRFNEAFSFIVNCDSQEEVDYFWDKLSAVPEAEQCGWVKDQFGLSWQIVPRDWGAMMSKGTPEQMGRLMKAMLAMKKFDIAELEKAYNGE